MHGVESDGDDDTETALHCTADCLEEIRSRHGCPIDHQLIRSIDGQDQEQTSSDHRDDRTRGGSPNQGSRGVHSAMHCSFPPQKYQRQQQQPQLCTTAPLGNVTCWVPAQGVFIRYGSDYCFCYNRARANISRSLFWDFGGSAEIAAHLSQMYVLPLW
jgi:hypothetical protein